MVRIIRLIMVVVPVSGVTIDLSLGAGSRQQGFMVHLFPFTATRTSPLENSLITTPTWPKACHGTQGKFR